MIEAAGGLVWRAGHGPGAPVDVLLVHRPRYDDWTFPKGKLDPGEAHEQAAVREVAEETGLRCELLEELLEARYEDRHGRPKRVRYWAMQPVSGAFAPNDEVDAVEWLPVDQASPRLTYPRDREVLMAAARVQSRPPTRVQRHYRQ